MCFFLPRFFYPRELKFLKVKNSQHSFKDSSVVNSTHYMKVVLWIYPHFLVYEGISMT